MKRFISLILIFILLGFVYSNFTVGVSEYTVSFSELPDDFSGYKIVQLSDLHNRRYPFMMAKINKLKPDIVVMTGDMVSSSDTDYTSFLSLAEKVSKRYPTYFIVGNHEQMLSDLNYERLIAAVSDLGIEVLDNSKAELERGNSKINLFGLWFNLRYYRDLNDEKEAGYFVDKEKMDELLGRAPEGCNILLAHSPVFFDGYAEWGADLTLSGHMHGGMIRIPFYGGLFSPEREFFPKYDAGLFEQKNSKLIISRGLGEHIGFRLFNQPEIVLIKLMQND